MRKFFLSWLVLPLAAITLCGAEYARVPTTNEVLSTLKPGHPRLFIDAELLGKLKARAPSDTFLAPWHHKLVTSAFSLLTNAPSTYEIPDGLRLLATSRRVVNRVSTLALAYHLTSESRFAERAWRELEAAAAFPDWNPKHFLDTAEMTYAFALGYDWLYARWTPDQRQLLRQAIVEKGLKPALDTYGGKGGWPRVRHNWNQVCNGGIGVGALAIAEDEPEWCARILVEAIASLPRAMDEFAPDGAWAEGPGYWHYATTYNVAFLAAMETALGTDFGLSQAPAFAQTGLFPMYLTSPIERTFNYADGSDGAIRAPQMFWLARKFDHPAFAWYQDHFATGDAFDLIWRSQLAKPAPGPGSLPLDKHFAGAEIVTFRGSWDQRQSAFLGFKGGDNKANHSHLDLGSFVFDTQGVRWAVDLGADNYNFPGYFGPKRWEYYRLRAEGQNTLVLNPGSGPDQDPRAEAKITRFKSTPARASAVVDLTGAYRQHVNRAERGYALLDRRLLLIQDEIAAENPVEAWWFMHTAADITLGEDGRTATLSRDGKSLVAHLLSPESARFESRPALPLPSSPAPEMQAKNEKFRKLTVHLPGAREERLAVLLSPDARLEDTSRTLTPLKDW